MILGVFSFYVCSNYLIRREFKGIKNRVPEEYQFLGNRISSHASTVKVKQMVIYQTQISLPQIRLFHLTRIFSK